MQSGIDEYESSENFALDVCRSLKVPRPLKVRFLFRLRFWLENDPLTNSKEDVRRKFVWWLSAGYKKLLSIGHRHGCYFEVVCVFVVLRSALISNFPSNTKDGNVQSHHFHSPPFIPKNLFTVATQWSVKHFYSISWYLISCFYQFRFFCQP